MAVVKSKPLAMIKGGKSCGENNGITGSSRHFPKGGSVNKTAAFNPRNDKRRGATNWAVGAR